MSYKPPYAIPEVMKMRSEGQSLSRIAQRFGRSRTRVAQIIKEERTRVASLERAKGLRRQIRASNDLNDLDRKLSIDDLFCILELPPIVSERFKRSFERDGIRALSLRQFMDVLIPIVDNPKNFYDVLPAFKIRTIGKKSYAAVTMRLSSLDVGNAFRKEWAERRRRLKEYLMASEGYHKSKSLLYRFCGANDEA
jgi:hypothetical protein